MPIINPTLPSDGDSAIVSPYNTAIQAILAVLNGALDQDNLASGAVILSKLSTALQQALVPAGAIIPYGGSAAPSGFLLCYGQAVSRSTYSDLFAIIGTSFGVGDGTSTFNVPDMRGRVPVGIDNAGGTAANRIQRSTTLTTTNANATATVGSATGLSVGDYILSTNVPAGTTILTISGTTITMSANATATASTIAARFGLFANDAQVIGASGGTDVHTLILAQTAAHDHGLNATTTHTGGSGYSHASGGGSWNFASEASAVFNGGDQPHPNVQPSQLVNYIVKV